MWRQLHYCGLWIFFLFCMTNKIAYLVLRDETVGLHGLLPLKEDHVIERGEGQWLRSDAAGNYSRRKEKQLSLKQTLRSGLKLMASSAVIPGGKNNSDRAKKRHRDGEGWRGIRATEQRGGDERKPRTGLLSALRMNCDSSFCCLITEHSVNFSSFSTLQTEK